MLREKRQQQILEQLHRDGAVEISQLCKAFDVTEMTIRRDLDALTQTNKVIRTYGGAMLANQDSISELSIDKRLQSNRDAKNAIARKALEYVQSGKIIYLDSGTTCLYVARLAPRDLQNVVVTNGLNIAQELLMRPYSSVLLTGGDVRANTNACRGALAEEMMKRFRIDTAFLGTNNVGEDGFLYIGNAAESGIKKTVISVSAEIFVLADSSKLNSYNLLSYAHLSEISHLVTDDGIDASTLKRYRKMGVDIIVARTKD